MIDPQTLKRSFTLIRNYFSHFYQRGTKIIMNDQGSVSYFIIKMYTPAMQPLLHLQGQLHSSIAKPRSYSNLHVGDCRVRNKFSGGERGSDIFSWATEIKFKIWVNVFVGHGCPRFQLKQSWIYENLCYWTETQCETYWRTNWRTDKKKTECIPRLVTRA
jgi:hypothetical protein